MSTLREFLEKEYTANPGKLGLIAESSFYLIKVRRSFWRGQRVMKNSKVLIQGDREVGQDLASVPRWNLCPDDIKSEFTALLRNTDRVLGQYCVGGIQDENGEALNSLIGNGVYVVDKVYWSRLSQLLTAACEQWANLADDICSEEGYDNLIGMIKEKVSEDLFEQIREHIPKRESLRRKFKMTYEVLPVRMTHDPQIDDSDKAVLDGKMSLVIDTLESAIKYPRLQLAEGVNRFLESFTESCRPTVVFKRTKNGAKRGIRYDSYVAFRKSLSDWELHNKYADNELLNAVSRLTSVLPTVEDEEKNSSLSHSVVSSEEFANEVINRLLDVVDSALNENNMIASLGNMTHSNQT